MFNTLDFNNILWELKNKFMSVWVNQISAIKPTKMDDKKIEKPKEQMNTNKRSKGWSNSKGYLPKNQAMIITPGKWIKPESIH